MADKGQINYRANLSSAIFPLNSKQVGQSVISRGLDQDDINSIPQVLYMENVLPTPLGYQSISYTQGDFMSSWSGGTITRVLRVGKMYVEASSGVFAPLEVPYAVALQSNGKFGTYFPTLAVKMDDGTGEMPAATIDPGVIYSAAVADKAYCLINNVPFTVDSAGGATTVAGSVSPVGFFLNKLAPTIIGSFGYLIICDYNTVYWSSLADPLDFTSSLVTGAGSINPQGITSSIHSCAPHSTGFYIFTANEVLTATATGNTRYPWKFSVVKGADPLTFGTSSYGAPNNAPAVYTDKDFPLDIYCSAAGQIKVISGNGAETVATELSSLLERELGYEEFSWATKQVTYVPTNGFVQISNKSYPVSVLNNRYVVISYGTYATPTYDRQRFKFLWVYDIVLKKYGKLRVDHTHVVLGTIYDSYDYKTYKLNTDTLAEYEFNAYGAYSQTQPDSIILFGKFQLERGRMLKLEEIKLSDVETRNLTVNAVPSPFGKDVGTSVVPYVTSGSSRYYQSLMHETSRSWTIAVKGVFAINTLELTFADGGSE